MIGLPQWLSGKESACQCRRLGFNPWSWKSPWRRKWQPTPSILVWKIPWIEEPGRLCPWICKGSDMTEQQQQHDNNCLDYLKEKRMQFLIQKTPKMDLQKIPFSDSFLASSEGLITTDQDWSRSFLCSIVTAAAAAKLLQSCPTLCDPIDGSPLGSPVPGILQARTLEWVAISFSSA